MEHTGTPLAIIGGGTMGQAIVRGGQTGGPLSDAPVVVGEPDLLKHSQLRALRNVEVVTSAVEAIQRLAEYERRAGRPGQVLLAVKPQMLSAVSAELAGQIGERVVISILAGMPGERVRAALGGRCRVVRAMPNLPAKIGQGATATCMAAGARDGDDEYARLLFQGVGRLVVTIDESLMDAFTAVAGSGPAYLFLLAEAMVHAAAEIGFDKKTAHDIVRQTIAGAAALLSDSVEAPAELRKAVTSKGGTTEAALRVLDDAGFAPAMLRAVTAARDRGRELGAM